MLALSIFDSQVRLFLFRGTCATIIVYLNRHVAEFHQQYKSNVVHEMKPDASAVAQFHEEHVCSRVRQMCTL